jgi:HK97 family phage major capsid protein
MGFTDKTERTGTSQTARQIPETVAAGILSDVYEDSAVLRLGRVFRMPAYSHRIPVLKAFADAFWLQGANQAAKDSALKETTTVQWDNVYITPDELAVLVVVPDAWMDDSDITWAELRKEVSRAFAQKIDQAVLFGDGNPPAGFSGPVGGVVGGAVSAGNFVTLGSTLSGTYNDVGLDLAAVAEDLAKDGYDPNGWVARKGFRWRLVKLRDTTGQPIYTSTLSGNPPGPSTGSLYDQPYYEVGNGAWDDTEALAIAGEWDKLVVGVRQDMSFSVFDQGVITNASGTIVYNAMQQDGKILRAVMRLGYNVPNPVKKLGGTFPFGLLRPVGAS